MTAGARPAATRVRIVEVAPRDGLQNEPVSLDAAEKRRLIMSAVAYGARAVEATSFVHPAKVPAMADAEEVLAGLSPLPGVGISALILNERGLERAARAGVREVNAVVHCTDAFSRRNQGTDIAGGVAIWRRIRRTAAELGITANATLAVAFGCPFDGEVAVERLRGIAAAVLDDPPGELSLADTIGVAVPADVARRFAAVRGLLDDRGLSDTVALRGHFHNTRNTGIANALAAVDAGATVLDASLGGIGGCPFAPQATGNIATEDLAYALGRSGIAHGLDEAVLREAGRRLAERFGRRLPSGVLYAGGFPG